MELMVVTAKLEAVTSLLFQRQIMPPQSQTVQIVHENQIGEAIQRSEQFAHWKGKKGVSLLAIHGMSVPSRMMPLIITHFPESTRHYYRFRHWDCRFDSVESMLYSCLAQSFFGAMERNKKPQYSSKRLASQDRGHCKTSLISIVICCRLM